MPDADLLLTVPIGTNEIKRAINKIKEGKSAGTDGIYSDMTKNLGKRLLLARCNNIRHNKNF